MKNLLFLNEPLCYSDKTEFIGYLSKVQGKEDLLITLSKTLSFPDYFGFNWDALSDCLRDFHWVDKKGVVLVHNGMPKLDDTDFNVYIEILIDSIKDWKEGEEHYFKVVFPEEIEESIKKIMNIQ